MADLQGTSRSHGRTPCVAHPVQAALRDISTNSVSFPNEGFAHAFNRPAEVVDHSTGAHRCSLAAERGYRRQPEVSKCSYQRSRGFEYAATSLLPGGEHLVVLTTTGDIILKRIERGNGIEGPEWILIDVARYSLPDSANSSIETVFTDVICEYPLVALHIWVNARYVTRFVEYSPRLFCS